MTDLINKTLMTETGLTLCKPDIYSLDVIQDKGVKQLCLYHLGNEIVRFTLSEEIKEKLTKLISA
ncbi:hypothetical protein [Photorhabdus heterorhabditis]|uniref:Uncharacterized protein n=1 Tax=Photorhabdus heterorhabditis TaxID=880156 RepID=A0A5B0WDG5_9GAMM|nr:hypothetical protein [Photorhabdus heterorhabditis]KAA1184906.1 hypothetical protein F0L16_15140 [Photorhabdus heterorhabditis]